VGEGEWLIERGPGVKGNAKVKAMGTGVKRKSRSESRRSAVGWGALVHQRGEGEAGALPVGGGACGAPGLIRQLH